ncbi:MAG: FecR domain-containing protein [Turneriella sp.]|nr:FecR domain-containing protein [Turneriella sp.]
MKKLIAVVITIALLACKEKKEVSQKTASHAAAVVFVVGKDAKLITAKGEIPAAKGAILQESDKVITGQRSQVDLVLPNKILIRIDQNSTVEMREFAQLEGGAQRDRLMLQKGAVFAKVAKLDKKSSFAIQTPTLVAGVRGTQFMTEADENGKAKVAVIEGTVGVETSAGKVEEVNAGEQAEVSPSGSIVENKIDEATAAKTNSLATVANIKEAELQKFENLLSDQQKLLDEKSGRDKIEGMKQDTDKRIQQEKDKASEKIGDIKGQTDSKIQEMKSQTDEKVKQSSEKVDSMKADTQQKIDSMKGSNVDNMKKKQEELFKKFP